MLHRFSILLICLGISGGICAQSIDERNFHRYTTLHGLSDNEISGIVQDDKGFIWISTKNGLTRFDGQEMQAIHQQPGENSLMIDKLDGIKCVNNKLLVYSLYGAQLFEPDNNLFTRLQISIGKKFPAYQKNVYDAAVIGDKAYVLSTSSGFYSFNKTGKMIFRYDFFKPDPKNTTWPSTGYGRFMVTLDSLRILQFDHVFKIHIYDLKLNRFFSDREFIKNYPNLYALQGKQLLVRGIFNNNKLIFNDPYNSKMLIYQVGKDLVYKQPVPPWFQKNIAWSTRWLTLNDSTAVIFNGRPGLQLIHINPATGSFNYDPRVCFRNYDCRAVMLDKDNRLWVGTSNGLFVQNTKKNIIHTIDLSKWTRNDSVKYETNDLFIYNRDLYVGSYTYLPIMVLDAETYKLKKYISFEKISPLCNQVWHIIHYRKDTLWFATQGGLIWYNTTNGSFGRQDIPPLISLNNMAVTLCYKDSHGLLWLQGNWGTGLIVYDPHTGKARKYHADSSQYHLPLRVVNFITEDRQGNIWLAEEGLTRWNRNTAQFDTLISSYGGFNKDNQKIISLSNDGSGQLAFCNEYNGALLFNPVNGSYQQLSTKNALFENAALTVKGLSNGYLWVLTRNGISGWNRSAGKTINYSYKDGLPIERFNGAIFHDGVGARMLFGYDGYLVWTPDSIANDPNKHTAFYIDRITLPGDTAFYFPTNEITFDHRHNNLVLHFSAINFNDPDNNRYAYHINDKAWVALGNENSIHFNDLAPGKYKIEIKYFSAASSVKEIAKTLVIIVRPPFWLTVWFILPVCVFILLMIYLYYRNRLYEISRLNNLDTQLAQMEMKALQAQMNPHFIFNCLNSIKEMILHQENNEASRYLSQFAQLIRLSLEQSSHTFISLRASIEYLEQYVKMEKIRNPNFHCVFEKCAAVDEYKTMLIPTFIQPVIENAIWHGLPGKERQLIIKVSFFEEMGRLVCIVDDNGIGIRRSENNKVQITPSHRSVGIANIKERIRLLNEKYKFEVSMQIVDRSSIPGSVETGTIVTILFPLKFLNHERPVDKNNIGG